MCCEPIWTALGQTYWVVMKVVVSYPNMSWFVQHSALIPKHQHQDEHRLSQWKSSALWNKCWVELQGSKRKNNIPSQLAQDAGSSMLHVWIRGLSETFHHHPFVSQPCRTLGPSRGSWLWYDFQYNVRSSRLQHICVFSHQCEIVQYDGRLMLKQDWYYDLGESFFLPMFQNFYTIFLIFTEQIDALWEYCITDLY